MRSRCCSASREKFSGGRNDSRRKLESKNLEGVELYNKTLGIIGMGRIGSELSRRAIAFGMRVLAFDPYLSASRARSLQVELVEEIDELLAAADFISLHTPLTAETRHILNVERLAKTKRGVRIINCARGGLIDEQALADAISSGHVAGAALDVFETEPLPPDSPLRKIPNLVLTPHLGASTAEAQESVEIEIAQYPFGRPCSRGQSASLKNKNLYACESPRREGKTRLGIFRSGESGGDNGSVSQTFQCGAGDVTARYSIGQCLLVNQSATRAIDDAHATFCLRETFHIQDMAGLCGKRRVPAK